MEFGMKKDRPKQRPKRKPSPPTVAKWLGLKTEAHDRQAQEIPANARIAPHEINDPNAVGETERIVVVRSISNDPLAWLHAHHRIDDAKYYAGREWQQLYERAVMGAIQSVDTSKEPVDGGRWPDMWSDQHAMASRELARLAKVLGHDQATLLSDVLGLGMFIEQAAQARGVVSDHGRRKVARTFHGALESLATELGYAMRKAA